MQLEFDFGETYEVICMSEYCTFRVAHGSKEYCEKYIQNNSSEYTFPLVIKLSH